MSKTARKPLARRILSTLFTVTVSVVGLALCVLSVARWVEGNSPIVGMILGVYAGLFVAVTFGLLPLWGEYVSPQSRAD